MSSTDLIPYQHEALDLGMIRVLFIRWAMKSDDMLCAIYHTTPGEINYTAVSYAWESDRDDYETVAIPLLDILDVEYDNGTIGLEFTDHPRRQLSVKKSLWKMILAAGRIGDDDDLNGESDRSKSMAIAVWIDQICINQSNNAEKSAQVKMMHLVYQMAEDTIIYVGEQTDKTTIAFEAGYALASLVELDDDKIPVERETQQEGWTRSLKRLDWAAIKKTPNYTPKYIEFKEGAGDEIHPFRQFAMDILGRRWWDRTWVLQELVCSRAVEIMIGKFKISWDLTLAACRVALKLG